MSSDKRNISVNDYEMNIDLYSILRDIWKYALVILLLAASMSLLSYVYVGRNYHKQYESTSTFIVSSKGSNNSVYSDLSATSEMATKFSEILNSSILQKKVAKEMDMDYFPGSASAEVVNETNLLVLKVQADSPEMAFRLNKAIMNNYSVVTDQLIGNVVLDVLQKPTVPSGPVNKFQPTALMKKTFFTTIVALCGLIAILSFLKDTVRKPKEVSRKLDAKLLQTLYHEKIYKTWKARIHRKKSPVLLTNPGTSFQYVEDMKKLARKVSSKMKEKNAKTLLVASVEENEGKSTVAANLALALAEESEKVLLIDADLRKPSQYKIFGLNQEEIQQFGEVLNGNEQIDNLVTDLPKSELLLIAGSMIYPNSTEMIASPIFQKIVEFFKTKLDYIIIDTPPMSQAADAEELVDLADASILVVRQHTALVKDINETISILNSAEGTMLGCVYNDVFHGVAQTARNYGYKYAYGSGYGYGNKYGYGNHGYGYGYGYGYGWWGAGCEYAFMEVSSHSIAQKRISGLKFAGGIFTNLTRDHLDYHKTVENYLKAKKKFFDDLPKNAFSLTNLDDKNGLVMTQNTRSKVYTYSLRSLSDFKGRVLESHFEGMLLDFNNHELAVQFIGKFNASNLLAVFGAAVLLGKKEEDVLVALSTLHPVAGRFDAVRSKDGVTAIVDYAHTPDALTNVLNAIHGVLEGKGKVITVVGAGGNRDKGKRPIMAKEAAKASDRVIITSDNPRFEEPQDIINDMLAGLDAEDMRKTLSITDRKEAIRTACMLAEKGDVILIAGKGHENYQEIKGVKHHFDDKEEVKRMLND